MTFHVRPSKNFVNLGTLYQRKLRVRPSNRRVNLTMGYGYFDDGSMLIAPNAYCGHDVFEKRMNLAAQAFSTPVPQIKALEDKRSHGKRVIVVDLSCYHNSILRLIIRSAQDKERVSMHDSSFDSMTLNFDKLATRIRRTRLHDPVTLVAKDVNRLQAALRKFRGTLIDGVLHPNILLGNGLDLQGTRTRAIRLEDERQTAVALCAPPDMNCKEPETVPNNTTRQDRPRVNENIELMGEMPKTRPPPHVERRVRPASPSRLNQENVRRRGSLVRRDILRVEKDIHSGAEAPKPRSLPHAEHEAASAIPDISNQKDVIQRATLELQATERRLRNKERELELKEETLRMKYKAWSLEQRLAKRQHTMSSRRRRIEERHPGSLRIPITNTPHTATEEPQNASLPDHRLPQTGDPIPSSKSSKPAQHSPSATDDVKTPNTPPNPPQKPSTTEERSPQSSVENTSDPSPPNDFNLNEPTPPPALAALRSRIAIPGRRRRASRPP